MGFNDYGLKGRKSANGFLTVSLQFKFAKLLLIKVGYREVSGHQFSDYLSNLGSQH